MAAKRGKVKVTSDINCPDCPGVSVFRCLAGINQDAILVAHRGALGQGIDAKKILEIGGTFG